MQAFRRHTLLILMLGTLFLTGCIGGLTPGGPNGGGGSGGNGGGPTPQPPYNVSGRVLDTEGDPIQGAVIHVAGRTESLVTDAEGRWSVQGVTGPTAVTVAAHGWEFPIQTRLALGSDANLDFVGHEIYHYPMSSHIAFQYRHGCANTACTTPFSIWKFTLSGLKMDQLTDEEGSDLSPTWSPDGTRIAFASDRNAASGHFRIWTMVDDGTDLLDTGVEGWAPAWSPDGGRIAFVQGTTIRVMDVGTDGTPFGPPQSLATGTAPTWSPDGTKIAFEHDGAIWAMEADGRHVTRLAAEGRTPAWSPDGSRILYTVPYLGASSRLRIMDADGKNSSSLAGFPDHAAIQPAWSADGVEVAYALHQLIPYEFRLVFAPLADGAAWAYLPIPEPGPHWAVSPAWSPQ